MTMCRPAFLLLFLLAARPSLANWSESSLPHWSLSGACFNVCSVNGSAVQAGSMGGMPVAVQTLAQSDEPVPAAWSNARFSCANGTGGVVYAVATDGTGKWYVGGSFTMVNGTQNLSVNHIACFDAKTNTWSPLGNASGNGVNGEVRAIVVVGNSVIVGGEFTQANVGSSSPVSVNNLARFDLSTQTWSPLGSEAGNGVNGRVYALSVLGSRIFVGGDFTQANVGSAAQVPANHLAMFNVRNSTWSALGTAGGNGVNGVVYAIASVGEEVFIGGDFTEANCGGAVLKANAIARFHLTANRWSTLGSGGGNGVSGASQPAVYALAVSGEDVFVGGEFTQVNAGSPILANYIARFHTGTNTWSPLGKPPGNGVNGAVNAIAVLGNSVFVGGFFTKANLGATLPVMASYVARFHLDSQTWSVLSSGSGVNNEVYAIAASGNDVFIGGNFTQANVGGSATVSASFVVRFNAGTNTWSVIGFELGYQHRNFQDAQPSAKQAQSLQSDALVVAAAVGGSKTALMLT
ncbi:MAG: hypothetical protein RML35_01845 [Chloroherpetonaceae bacterium]|nr:hypothetical protein [Chloroherpetonaceae bacterium]MDW8464953.1 hypothetical protein [Chloroherpetonaceae bacterium]